MLEMAFGFAGLAAGLIFLLYCLRGFSRATRAIRHKAETANVFPLTRHRRRKRGPTVIFLGSVLLPIAALHAQTTTPPEQAPSAPASSAPDQPAIVGPLSLGAPAQFNAGPLGTLSVSGVLSGSGLWQNHPATNDSGANADISNGQLLVEKASGTVQYYLQAGAYNLPALGTAFISTGRTVKAFYGPLPEAFVKIAPHGSFSFLAGQLPTLLGAEDTFTFENMNIERGLLWNQENAISRGVQVNYSKGKLSASGSWNDGFYSGRYNWLTGTLTYTGSGGNSLEFAAGGNVGHTGYSSTATPLYQNNSAIYNVIYTHTAKRWTLQPYIQYTRVPADPRARPTRTTSTMGGAVLGSYNLRPGLFLAGRAEYIGSSGSATSSSANLMYGPGSRAWSLTITPTYQRKAFFTRGEISFTKAVDATRGNAFGPQGLNTSQARGMVEAGFMF